jgi:catechol 2,3-dioxygenase-like lactoylglutathione lyase family enzyme
VEPKTLDHVAFWVANREDVGRFLEQHLGMHVIAQEDNFTLMGADARRGKLTLFDAEGPRAPGAFEHVALRVSDLVAARAALPEGSSEIVDLGDGLRITLVEAPTDVEYDLDHVALYASDPDATAAAYELYGFTRVGATSVEVGGSFVQLDPGSAEPPERPLLNHLAVLVDSADEHIAEAKDLGIEVESVVDAANTYAAFLRGPDGVRIEYVEHKPSFSLT